MLNRNVNTYYSNDKNIMSIMSINVFKSILVIKSHSVIDLFFAVSLKLWGLGRPKVIGKR